MNTPKKNLIISTAAVLVVCAGGLVLLNKIKKDAPVDGGATTTQPATSTVTTINGITISGPGSVTITPDTAVNIAAPDHAKELSFPASFSPEVQTALRAQFVSVQKTLATNPTDFNAWLNLGIMRKMVGDYTGAETVWIYLSKLYPTNTVTYGNLGGLYMDFLKDYAKAEASYMQAIKSQPTNTDLYRVLFSLYTDYGYKAGTTAAPDILKKGIAANGDTIDLRVLLARYYVKSGDSAGAQAQYDAAIAAAQKAGNMTLVAELTAEKGQ